MNSEILNEALFELSLSFDIFCSSHMSMNSEILKETSFELSLSFDVFIQSTHTIHEETLILKEMTNLFIYLKYIFYYQ